MLQRTETLQFLGDLYHLRLDPAKGSWGTRGATLQALDFGNEGKSFLLLLLEKRLEVNLWRRRGWRWCRSRGDDDCLPGGGGGDLYRGWHQGAGGFHNLRLFHDVSRDLAAVEIEYQLIGDVLCDGSREADGVDDGGDGGGGGDQDAPDLPLVAHLQPCTSLPLHTALGKELLQRCSSLKAARLFKVTCILQLFEHINGSGWFLCLLTLLYQLLL